MSPWNCPGAYAIIPYIEHAFGIYHVRGGLSTISEKMTKIFTMHGGRIHYQTPVKKLLIKNKTAVGISLENGNDVYADHIIVNSDFAYAASHLFPENELSKYKKSKIEKMKRSCSTWMMYLGIDGKLDLRTHSIFFAKNYKENIQGIFRGEITYDDLSFYVRNAADVDDSLAPKGKSGIYILVPTPNLEHEIDWNDASKKIEHYVLKTLETKLGCANLKERIETKKVITPPEWETEFNVYKGAVFNLAHSLDQMLWFRPHNAFEDIKNCFLVGGGTHPGSGLPTIYESGRIVADLLSKK